MVNPVEKINSNIYNRIIEYPISFSEIIDCILKAQDEISEACNPKFNKYTHLTIPQNDSTQWGCMYENEFRYRMNQLGILHFEPGDHNTGEDLTCIDNPEYSIEFKTSQTTQFWNTNSNGRIQESTKYDNPDKKCFYILVKHEVNHISNIEASTKVKSIKFGMLSKNDWSNSNGGGAAYLKKDVIANNFVEIWNDKIGNTIDAYQGELDNEYYEKMIELENNIL